MQNKDDGQIRYLVRVRVVTVLAVMAAVTALAGVAAAAPIRAHLRPAVRPSVAATFDTSTESTFVPIAPCRLVDTRKGGGPIIAGHPRSFVAEGGGVATQGGSADGCGIPAATSALQVIIQSVDTTGSGYINATPYGVAFATSSYLHYLPGQVIGSGATLTITPEAVRQFSLSASAHQTDVVIDVTGYYIVPMWAEVSSTGTLLRGSRALASKHVTGTLLNIYFVTFDRSIAGCAVLASNEDFALEVSAGVDADDHTMAAIVFDDPSGGFEKDNTFYVQITC